MHESLQLDKQEVRAKNKNYMQPMMRKIYRGDVDKEKQQYLALCD